MQSGSLQREVFSVLFRAFVIVITIIASITLISAMYEFESSVSDGVCNVAVLPVEGAILPFHGLEDYPLTVTPEEVERFFDQVESESAIEAVLVEINSPGGTPVAAARIAERFRQSPLPVIGLIGDIGASGGYLAAAGTDQLIASPMSDVGGIGVTMSYLEESQKNEQEGINYVELAAGRFKDAGSPNKPLTEEERVRFEADLQVIYDEFVDLVAEYREIPREEVLDVADGATMPGRNAAALGLVDTLGGRQEARLAISEWTDLTPEAVEFCEYEDPLLWL